MVILITGLCSTNCWYCPLSAKKQGKDVIYADEWQLKDEDDTLTLLTEARLINATGAGITGGDPLLVWKRTQTFIECLKNTFGSSFHIHMYTSGLTNSEKISSLIEAGLDEIRFHPPPNYWNSMQKSPLNAIIKQCVNSSISVAIEVPALPDREADLLSLIKWADDHQVAYVNLNELEFSESNTQPLQAKGYSQKHELSAAVHGSQETALSVMNELEHQNVSLGVHYCSVSFKDGIQLRNRLKRRAHNIARDFDVITQDGMIIKGVICHPDHSLNDIYKFLQTTYDIPDRFLFKDMEKHRIELGGWIVEHIAPELILHGYQCYLVEEYPTADRLEVERIPLPLDQEPAIL